MKTHTYLGDAVYAEWRNNHIILRVGRHDAHASVILEPAVLHALFEFVHRCKQSERRCGSEAEYHSSEMPSGSDDYIEPPPEGVD